MSDVPAAADVVDMVIIGAGFAGLHMLRKARDELGMSVRCFEAAPDVGGTWWWNRYPGVQCDTPVLSYCYRWAEAVNQRWSWTHRYHSGEKIQAYIRAVAEEYTLLPDISLNTRVEAAF